MGLLYFGAVWLKPLAKRKQWAWNRFGWTPTQQPGRGRWPAETMRGTTRLAGLIENGSRRGLPATGRQQPTEGADKQCFEPSYGRCCRSSRAEVESDIRHLRTIPDAGPMDDPAAIRGVR